MNRTTKKQYCVINYRIGLEVVSVENGWVMVKFTSEVQLPRGTRPMQPKEARVKLVYDSGFSDIWSLAERDYYRRLNNETVQIGIDTNERHQRRRIEDSLGSVDPLS